MPTKVDELEEEALKLDLDDRAALAERLIASLEPASDAEIERLWIGEAQRRLAELREGKVREVPADEVLRRARAALS